MAKFEASALHKVNPKLLGSQKKKEFGCNAESPGARAIVGRVSHTPVTGEHKWSTAWG